jgi:hypothetical protein
VRFITAEPQLEGTIIILMTTLFEKDFLMLAKWQNPPIVITDQPILIPTPVPSMEIATKYNLMEETFGENWAKEPADKYLAPSYCTIGN